MSNRFEKPVFFRRISLITLIAVYFLILVGGIVRSTGSGMGCPDWPKCFGSWVPPTQEAQLPEDYKEKYVEYRKEKNQRFAQYLDKLGLDKKAEVLRSDVSILEKTEFNSTKTWTEYINRLIGAIIGLLIIVNLIASYQYIKTDSKIFMLSLLLFFLVVFQGWIGSIVVSTNLVPWMVTVHMLIAVVIIGLLVYLVFRSRRSELKVMKMSDLRVLNSLMILSLGFLVIQIILGTQVREAIDTIAASFNYQDRQLWISEIGNKYFIHRSFSIIIIGCQLVIVLVLFRNKQADLKLLNFANILLALVLIEVALGAIMGYFAIPAYIQPAHLLFAVAIFGMQLLTLFTLNNYNKKPVKVRKEKIN